MTANKVSSTFCSTECLVLHIKYSLSVITYPCPWYPLWHRVLIQYIPRNMHTVFALLCFVVVIHWLIFPYPSGLLHWHCGNLMIAPVPAKQPWWIWINTSWEFIMNDCITTTKQSTTKPCAYFLGYTVWQISAWHVSFLSMHVLSYVISSSPLIRLLPFLWHEMHFT